MNARRVLLAIFVVAGAALVTIGGVSAMSAAVALGAAYLGLRAGAAVLGAFARPLPEPPPPGELRRVRLLYRCSVCGTEVRMTVANDEAPAPPRHCQDEMELSAPLYE
ncbi:MAG: hypothetical protein ACKVWR_16475 [Acidimicrobiales bacterium]